MQAGAAVASNAANLIELESLSAVSLQDAIERGIERAARTLRDVQGAWVKEQELCVERGKIRAYRVVLQITSDG